MKIKIGDLFEHYQEADLTLITTNATLNSVGYLIMGKGVASEARRKFPGLEVILGNEVRKRTVLTFKNGSTVMTDPVYGFFLVPTYPAPRLGVFQTKIHWRDFSKLEVINFSAKLLRKWMSQNPKKKVHLAFPGIGQGNLNEDEVLRVLTRHRFDNKLILWKLK